MPSFYKEMPQISIFWKKRNSIYRCYFPCLESFVPVFLKDGLKKKNVFVLISIALHQHRHMDQPYSTFWSKHCYISSDGHRWIMHELLFGWILQEMLSSHFHILKVLMTDTTLPLPTCDYEFKVPWCTGKSRSPRSSCLQEASLHQ